MDLSFYSTGLGPGGFFADGLFSFSARNFIAARKAAPRFLPAPLRYATGLELDTITVVDPRSPAVPQLSTWAMMLVGFAGLAFAGYRRALRTPDPLIHRRAHPAYRGPL